MNYTGKKTGLKLRAAALLLAAVMLFSLVPVSAFAGTAFTLYFAVPSSWDKTNYDKIQCDYHDRESGDEGWHYLEMSNTGNYTAEGLEIYSVTFDSPTGCYYNVTFKALRDNNEVYYKNAYTNNQRHEDSDIIWDEDEGWKDYVPTPPTPAKTVYFDASYSKLGVMHYDLGTSEAYYRDNQTDTNKCLIPNPDVGKVYYFANGAYGNRSGEMTRVGSSDVYKVDLPEGYSAKIVFSSMELTSLEGNHKRGGSTTVLTVPADGGTCFFADANDYIIYDENFNGGYRGGYWGTYGERRNAEAGKSADIVDIPTGTLTRDADTYYIKTSLYDYYSDYELSGYNLDTRAGHDSNTFRRWYAFRIFDTALSNKYRSLYSESVVPLYTGQFQPNYSDWGFVYSSITDVFPLYGISQFNYFMSVNNSTLNAEGEGTYFDSAALGLVYHRLNGGDVKVKGATDTVLPYFDSGFLAGNNSYNAVIGETYSNVVFPFTRKTIDNVSYWHFDSAETTLTLKRSGSQYYLDPVTDNSERAKYKNLNSSGKHSSGDAISTEYGFFPFNSGATDDDGNTYNFGFGAKMELNFHLTENGKIKGTDGLEHPIIFRFSGDDDLWVFIDDNLVLDVGGDHAIVTGEINFADKVATVTSVKSSWGDPIPSTTSTFKLSGKNTDQHTMVIYYMERGMWSSNFKVDFNYPDDNQLVIEESVDAENVNKHLFPTTYATLKNTDFNIGIRNLATHYGTVATHPVENGQVIYQREIMDFGSAASGKLEPVTGAEYRLLTEVTAGGGSGSGDGTVVYSGPIAMKGGQYAVFDNEFRRGSYIAVDQSVDTYGELFKTKWTMFDYDGSVVTSFNTGSSVTNGSVTSLSEVEGLKPSDGRTEKIFREADENSYGTKYQTDGSATAPDNAFVFRSYKNPDGTSRDTSLKLLYENEVKVGSLTVTKVKREGAPDLSGEYTFTVVLSDVGGHDLEGHDVTETFTLRQGESKTFVGIPAGTTFTVTETGIPDGSELWSIDGDTSKTSATGTIEDGVTVTHTFANTPVTTIRVTKAQSPLSDTIVGTFRIIVIPTSGGAIPGSYDGAIIDTELAVGESSAAVPAVAGQQYAVIEILPDTETVLSSYVIGGTETDLAGKSSFTFEARIGANEITLNNYLEPYDVSVYVKKLWKDGEETIDKADAGLPATLSFKISYTLANDSTVHWLDDTYTLSRSQYNSGDMIKLADLPARVNGVLATYELWELDASGDPIVTGAVAFGEHQFTVSKDSQVSPDGLYYDFTFTNTLVQDKVQLTIVKSWYAYPTGDFISDGSGSGTVAPLPVTDPDAIPDGAYARFQLQKRAVGGTEWVNVKVITINANTGDSNVGRDSYNEVFDRFIDEVEYEYRVFEIDDEGNRLEAGSVFYTGFGKVQYDGSDGVSEGSALNVTFKNVLLPPDPEIWVKKLWKDGENELTENIPDSISIALQRRSYPDSDEPTEPATPTGWETIDTFTLLKSEYGGKNLGRYPWDYDSGTYEYRVVERAPGGEIVEEGASVTVSGKSYTASYYYDIGADKYVIENSLVPEAFGSLTVTKTVSGSLGNKALSFGFTLKLIGYKLDPVPYGLTAESFEGDDGIYSFSLSHGDSITVTLPIGTEYEITETAVPGYTVRINNETSADRKITGTVADETPITVSYTNTLEGSVPTGIDLASGAPLLMSAAAGLAALIALRKKKED